MISTMHHLFTKPLMLGFALFLVLAAVISTAAGQNPMRHRPPTKNHAAEAAVAAPWGSSWQHSAEDELLEAPVARNANIVRSNTGSRRTDEVIGTGVQLASHVERGFEPGHEQRPGRHPGYAAARQPVEPMPAPDAGLGDMSYATDQYVSPRCGPHCGGCNACCCLLPCPKICWDSFSIFAGVQGFTGPPNRGSTGSFGFHEGFNLGSPFSCPPLCEIAWQIGARLTQSNLSGADYTTEERHQAFVTAGLFRRVDWGIQAGVAFDWLHESWYYTADVGQIRGEISWVYPCKHEVGFWFTNNVKSDEVTTTVRTIAGVNAAGANIPGATLTGTTNWTSTDLYALFYRRRFGECDANQTRLYAGFTGEGDTLLGMDGMSAISASLAFQVGFTYLIPNENQGAAGNLDAAHAQEGWNLSMSVVWYPFCGAAKSKNYNRPLFNVADNGSLMFDRK